MQFGNNNDTVHITIDGGATVSFITLTKAKSLNMKILKTSQDAIQADGISQLKVVGEVHEIFHRNKMEITFDALVCENLNGTDILGGMNFLYDNSIVPDARKQTITVGKMILPETNPLNVAKALTLQGLIPNQEPVSFTPRISSLDYGSKVNESFACQQVQIKNETIILPGDSYIVDLHPSLPHNHPYVVQPAVRAVKAREGLASVDNTWPSVRSVQAKHGKLELVNDTEVPIHLQPTDSIAAVRPLFSTPSSNIPNTKKIESQ